MASRHSMGATTRKIAATMLLASAIVGVLFPLLTLAFTTPTSPDAWWGLLVASLSLSLAVGVAAAFLVIRWTRSLLHRLADSAARSAGGLSDANRDIDTLADEVAALLAEVTRTLAQAQSANNDIRALTAQVLAATEQQASGAAEQAAAVAQTSATVEELAQTSRQIADNSAAVVAVAERTLESAEDGMQAVSDTAAGIGEIRVSTRVASDRIHALGQRSQQIGNVLVIIDDIAEQTKILALNAAIEAARAGEAGKGFSVVAEEIRKLAESVTRSTQEIDGVVREIQASTSALITSTERSAQKVEEGDLLARRTADALNRIVQQVEETTDAAKQISIATQQQRSASDQVVVSMREVAQVSSQSAGASRQIQSAIVELDRLADSLLIR